MSEKITANGKRLAAVPIFCGSPARQLKPIKKAKVQILNGKRLAAVPIFCGSPARQLKPIKKAKVQILFFCSSAFCQPELLLMSEPQADAALCPPA
ncbi:MAG: hypothetical protein EOO46_19265 [Flavobacterium sp.]|nr:MAG: hypothetical protein EOO46_19265 [Flavobacterium sp.]